MPYISQDKRESLNDGTPPLTPGELNYVITRTIDRFLGPRPTYLDINDAIGVLQCASYEVYRRVAAPYEDKKCAKNGDVYQERD